jgi:transcriptional regulator with XRE-family HTH domain
MPNTGTSSSKQANGVIDRSAVVDVGHRLRELRTGRDLSMRALAELSQLNVNTLSLIENNKTSPSVSTLQQLATALEVPITAFFENDLPKNSLAYLTANRRPRVTLTHGLLEDLSAGLTSRAVQPFVLTLEPHADSGPQPIVHTGVEFVYCLRGQISYQVEDRSFALGPGDSLLFESHLPHRWQNASEDAAQVLLVLCPADERDRPTERHFALKGASASGH